MRALTRTRTESSSKPRCSRRQREVRVAPRSNTGRLVFVIHTFRNRDAGYAAREATSERPLLRDLPGTTA